MCCNNRENCRIVRVMATNKQASNPFHYSNLLTYWECPRKWHYQREGWQPYQLPDPMLRGLLADRGVAAAWRGEDIRGAIAAEVAVHLATVDSARLDNAATSKDTIRNLGREAITMAQRYMEMLGRDLKPILVGTSVTKESAAGPILGTPDCVARHKRQRVLVELKTGHDPNPRMYSMTGQADFYAYLLGDIALIYYDLISPTSVMRYQRPPRLDRGQYLFQQLEKLALHAIAASRFKEQAAVDQPRYGWWCARCPFLEACQARDDGADEEEVLLTTMWQDDGRAANAKQLELGMEDQERRP